jgi:hypothetical protein
MLAHVCDAMNNSVLYKEVGKLRISQFRPMAATAALADILLEPAAQDAFRAKYAPIMGTILMRVGTSVGQKQVRWRGGEKRMRLLFGEVVLMLCCE